MSKAEDLINLARLIESPEKLENLMDRFKDTEIYELVQNAGSSVFHSVDQGSSPKQALISIAQELDILQLAGDNAELLKEFIVGLRKIASDLKDDSQPIDPEDDDIEDNDGQPLAGQDSIHTR